jgi:hypothetical protein
MGTCIACNKFRMLVDFKLRAKKYSFMRMLNNLNTAWTKLKSYEKMKKVTEFRYKVRCCPENLKLITLSEMSIKLAEIVSKHNGFQLLFL